MDKCDYCVHKDTLQCLDCRDSELVRKIIESLPKQSHFQNYIPVCPRGYKDCVHDPAYIKFYHKEWYKKLYGDMSPEEAIHKPNGCYENFVDDPNELYYCYDDEDK